MEVPVHDGSTSPQWKFQSAVEVPVHNGSSSPQWKFQSAMDDDYNDDDNNLL
jgi:hypothetical protein